MDTSSVELLARLREGDQQAAKEIFDRYVKRLVVLARRQIDQRIQGRVDAEDVVQSAWRSFFASLQKRDYDLENRGDLWRLLATITVRKVHQHVRRHTAAKRNVFAERAQPTEANDLASLVSTDAQPSPRHAAALIDELNVALQEFSDTQREIAQLLLLGLPIEDVAQRTHRTQRTVYRVLSRLQGLLEIRLLELAESES